MDIFRRYAPFIQDFIYRERWQSLRAVQNAAGDVLFNSGDNLLLSAATASGKTEAAFSDFNLALGGALYLGRGTLHCALEGVNQRPV